MKLTSVLKIVLPVIIIAGIAAGHFGCTLPPEARTPGSTIVTKDTAFTVLPLQTIPVTIGMEEDESLNGMITVTGGNNDITVYVKDDYGNIVLDPGIITGTYAFSYVAAKPGYYTVYFDNSDSVSVNKEIKLHYEVR